jgi:N-carbamoyl-D-amino-acid hydrolase
MPGDDRFRLAVAQVGGIDRSDTRAVVVSRLIDLLKEGKARGASFIVFPELTLTTFFPRYWIDSGVELNQYFETSMPNQHVEPLFACARQLGVGFYLGYAELTPTGHRYNTSILVDASGHVRGKYRKIHLPGHAERHTDVPTQHLEKKYFEVGNLGFGVFNCMGRKVGMCICNDRRWSEVYRVLGLQSAELVVLGYNTPVRNWAWRDQPHLRMFQHLLPMQAGAYENSVWVAAAAKCGSEDGNYMIGGSVIVSPSGEIAARAVTEDDEVIVADIHPELAANYRRYDFNFGQHRRPEAYGLITERTDRGAPLPPPSSD